MIKVTIMGDVVEVETRREEPVSTERQSDLSNSVIGEMVLGEPNGIHEWLREAGVEPHTVRMVVLELSGHGLNYTIERYPEAGQHGPHEPRA